jgi:hypothetical protein
MRTIDVFQKWVWIIFLENQRYISEVGLDNVFGKPEIYFRNGFLKVSRTKGTNPKNPPQKPAVIRSSSLIAARHTGLDFGPVLGST